MKLLIVILLLLYTAACGPIGKQDGAPVSTRINIASIADASPRVIPKSKYGNPISYSVFGKRYYVLKSSAGYVKEGVASWYGTKFHGRRTSSGETYDMYAMTAAHKTLPLPTFVRVTNLKNSKSVIVKVNDRGPFHEDRIIDLSYVAAIKLGITANGTGLVNVVALDPAQQGSNTQRMKTTMSVVKKASVEKLVVKESKYYVQIGAYADENNAQGVQSKLVRSNIGNVSVSQIDLLKQSVFRVRVGPLVSAESAEHVMDQLNDLGYAQSNVIVE